MQPGGGSKRNDKLKTYIHKDLLETPEWENIKQRFGLQKLGTPLERHEMGGRQMTIGDQAFHSGGPSGDEDLYKLASAKRTEAEKRGGRKPCKSCSRRRGGKKKKCEASTPAQGSELEKRQTGGGDTPKPRSKAEGKKADGEQQKSGALDWSQKKGRGRKGRKRGRGADAARRQDAFDGFYGVYDSPGQRGRGRQEYVHLMKRMGLDHLIVSGRREHKMQPRTSKKGEPLSVSFLPNVFCLLISSLEFLACVS